MYCLLILLNILLEIEMSYVKSTLISHSSHLIWLLFFGTYRISLLDVRVIWLRHLSPPWSPGLIWLIWLGGWVFPFFLTAPCVSLLNLHALSQGGQPSQNRGGPVFSQEYTSICAPLLEPPSKLSRISLYCRVIYTLHDFMYPYKI